jgi:DNA modification methylase
VPVFAVGRQLLHAALEQRPNLWQYAAASNRRDLSKSPIKPVALFSNSIRDVTRRGDSVLGSFCRSESLIIAAEKTGRSCCAVEADPRSVDLAIRRWQTLTGHDAVLEETGEAFDDRSLLAGSPGLAVGHGR